MSLREYAGRDNGWGERGGNLVRPGDHRAADAHRTVDIILADQTPGSPDRFDVAAIRDHDQLPTRIASLARESTH